MHALKEVLLQLPSLVNKGGIISFITYHSIEDRIVKRFIQNGCFESEPLKNEFGVADIPFKKTTNKSSSDLISSITFKKDGSK